MPVHLPISAHPHLFWLYIVTKNRVNITQHSHQEYRATSKLYAETNALDWCIVKVDGFGILVSTLLFPTYSSMRSGDKWMCPRTIIAMTWNKRQYTDPAPGREGATPEELYITTNDKPRPLHWMYGVLPKCCTKELQWRHQSGIHSNADKLLAPMNDSDDWRVQLFSCALCPSTGNRCVGAEQLCTRLLFIYCILAMPTATLSMPAQIGTELVASQG